LNQLQQLDAGRAALSGPMTLATVTELRREGRRALRGSTAPLVLDLGGVSVADSAGLALLVDWLAYAATIGRQLQFANPPAALQALARISDVMPLLAAGQ
jgi:phospholipid transport system transporter-binding protein